METTEEKQEIRRYFRLSIFIKGAISFAEICAGVLALFIPVSLVTDFVAHLAQGELGEDPHSFIATHLVTLAHQYSVASGTFIAFYLFSRGLIKLALIVALFKNKLWAYPWSLGVLGLFVLYQLYEIVTTHSSVVVGITLFDLVVMYFIWREYRIVRGAKGVTR